MIERVRLPVLRRSSGQRGAALFIVLVFAALMSSLAAVALRHTVSGARAAAVFLDGARADELGRATGDLVVAFMAAGGADRRRGGAFSVQLDTAVIAVDYLSESARIDLNTAPTKLLAALFGSAGADPDEVATAVDRVEKLRTPPTPAPAKPASTDDNAIPTVQGPPVAGIDSSAIQAADEVADKLGLPSDVVRRILPVLTVASRAPQVDPLLADRLVLSALLGGDPARVDDYVERRTRGFVTADEAKDPIPTDSRLFVTFSDAPAVHALARVTIANRLTRRFDVVVEPPGDAGTSTRILSWRPLT